MPTTLTLQSKYLEDSQGNKFAPITTPNAVRWPNGDNLNDKLGDSGNITVESNSAPTSSTLTYTKDGQTKDYAVGDKIIVPNAQSETGYNVWVLLHLASGVATWGIMDSEDDRVVFSACVENDDANLTITSQITATISINGGTPSPVAGTSDSVAGKKKFTAHVSVGDEYTITFGSINMCSTPSSITGIKTSSTAVVLSDSLYSKCSIKIILKTEDGTIDCLPEILPIVDDSTGDVYDSESSVLNTSSNTREYYYFGSNFYDKTFHTMCAVYETTSGENYWLYEHPFASRSYNSCIEKTFLLDKNTAVIFDLPSGNFWTKGNVAYMYKYSMTIIGSPTVPGSLWSYGDYHDPSHMWYRDGLRGEEGMYMVTESADGYMFTENNYAANDTGCNLTASYAGTPYDVCRYYNIQTYSGLNNSYLYDCNTPTEADIQELMDYTDREWDLNYMGTGTPGLKFMKKSDHSVHIFVPAVLTHYDETDKICYGVFLATRTMVTSDNNMYQRVFEAFYNVDSGYYNTGIIASKQRYTGWPVRPMGNFG